MVQSVELNKDQSGIAVMSLNRSKAANALSRQMLNEMKAALQSIHEDEFIRCLILTGSGEKVFCAGADLKERAGMNELEVRNTVALIRETINRVEELPVPVICAMNGSAFGGGLELALASDIRIASSHSSFGLTETSLGIIPGAGGTQRLPRLIGLAKAKELIFTARRIDAKEAERIGLISKTASKESLMEEAFTLAREIAGNAPLALRASKKAINQGAETGLQAGLKIEELCYGTIIDTNDRLEGLQAFKEKRKPVYTGH
ncbi:Enoyl-CoA hydratase/carnithine racemase [Bacillus sp. OV322]|uniref:enoyl-CoA hydratase n=1 Tax=Bacillus sp. OV322 TaxID=1882764 RepID=UPI0008E0AE93|nr:enoyl-CoA hydratase [Bacillus sp. OV322]SFC64489.1 Enoyl-CoA hydratase/carnithine racemase [Bacillus sp. OV322]